MSFAITDRPRTWDQIIGQKRAIQLVKSVLTRSRLLPRGFILEGPSGTGKTSTAYVLAKSLMCTGENPLGCGTCPSCLTLTDNPSYHPDYMMVDAASNSGVDAARRIVDAATDLPTLGRTRVVIVDEAHRLSQEAWDVYLAPLESLSMPCTFIFCTTEGRRIPFNIRGRCSRTRFFKVCSDDVVGLLVNVATNHHIDYDMDGMRTIAKASKGRVRDAVSLLEEVSDLGKVTRERVVETVDMALPDSALAILLHLAHGRFPEACKELEALALGYGSARVIEEVFSAYGRTMFGDADGTQEEEAIYKSLRSYFTNSCEVTATLLKWSATDRVPSDALPLFAHELLQHISERDKKPTTTAQKLPPTAIDQPQDTTPATRKVTRDELAKFLGGDTRS